MEQLYGRLMSLLARGILNPLLWNRSQVAAQRRGLAPTLPPADYPRWLLHGASAGELAAAAPLCKALAQRREDLRLVLSTQNQAGLAMAEQLARQQPMVQAVSYLPWDDYPALCYWLRGLGISRVLILETELWPGLYRACADLAIPLVLLNARLYPADVRRYHWIAPLIRSTLQRVDWIAARDEQDAAAFRALGAGRVKVHGELRHDLPLVNPQAAFPGSGLLLLGASTHAPEEALLLDALVALQDHHQGLRLVLAPRQVKRCGALAQQARRRGLRVVRWSMEGTAVDWQVLLIDRLGILAGLYAQASIVFIGGSFSRHGGHSPVEAALHGCPLLIGPRVEHIAAAVQALQARQAIEVLVDSKSLVHSLRRLLGDPCQRHQLGQNAQAWGVEGQGAAQRCAAELLP